MSCIILYWETEQIANITLGEGAGKGFSGRTTKKISETILLQTILPTVLHLWLYDPDVAPKFTSQNVPGFVISLPHLLVSFIFMFGILVLLVFLVCPYDQFPKFILLLRSRFYAPCQPMQLLFLFQFFFSIHNIYFF